MTSATDVLRRMLDERGVEHYDGTEGTLWGYEPTSDSTGAYRYSADETSDGYIQVQLWHVTPEQAIAATLGSCNCPNNCTNGERTETCRNVAADGFECSECKGWWAGPRGTENPMLWGFRFCPTCGRRVVQ